MPPSSLCVYCGSRPGISPAYLDAAREFGRLLAAANITLIYGGGHIGLMGALADATLRVGGQVIGVITEQLARKEIGHPSLTRLETVATMHDRKHRMAELADGFAALPGGVGTFEEILEVFTWAQLGLHAKPCAFLNVHGFYDPLLAFLRHTADQGFLHHAQLAPLIVSDTPADLLHRIRQFPPRQSTNRTESPPGPA